MVSAFVLMDLEENNNKSVADQLIAEYLRKLIAGIDTTTTEQNVNVKKKNGQLISSAVAR
ncbi:MAG: hypothetical protein RL007_819 [Bacteroidota bacterium]|jgi:aminoglycoside phosphotransferase family enzyme